jgi:hypothetical protein
MGRRKPDCLGSVGSREWWRALVNAVVNLRVLLSTGNLLLMKYPAVLSLIVS